MQKFSSIIGVLLAFALILSGIGVSNLANFIDIPSILIVVGGTIGTTLMIYGVDGLKASFSLVKVALTRNDRDRVAELVEVYNLALKARKESVLSLDKEVESIEDPFTKLGVQLVVDGTAMELTKDILMKEVENTAKRHMGSHDILNFISESAPAFGMVGTLIGLVGMLQNLSDPSMIGPQMAIALLTTFYGAVIANVVFIPLAKKLEKLTDLETILKLGIIEGLLAIQEELSPITVEMKLKTYLSPNMKELFSEEIA